MTILTDYIFKKQSRIKSDEGILRQNAIAKLKDLVVELREFLDSDLDVNDYCDPWEEKYDYVFSKEISQGKIKDLLSKANLYLDYYDPDTTYEEDVCAYVSALEKLVKETK